MRKLAYSIYCFLLSLVEIILKKEKIVPETGKKNQSQFALKFFHKFIDLGEGKKGICSQKIYTS